MAKELTILHRCGEVITKKRFCVNQLNLTPDQEKEIKWKSTRSAQELLMKL
jgi:hypothetical protein